MSKKYALTSSKQGEILLCAHEPAGGSRTVIIPPHRTNAVLFAVMRCDYAWLDDFMREQMSATALQEQKEPDVIYALKTTPTGSRLFRDNAGFAEVPPNEVDRVQAMIQGGNRLWLDLFWKANKGKPMPVFEIQQDAFGYHLVHWENPGQVRHSDRVLLMADQVDDARKLIESKDTVLLEKFWAIEKANEWLSSQPPAVSGQCGQSTARTVLSDYLSRVPSDADPVMVWSNICKWNQKNLPPFEQLELLTLSGFERRAVTAKGREVCETARKASRKYWAPKWPVVTADCPLSQHTAVVTTDATGAQKKVYATSVNFDKGTVEAVFTTDKGDRVTWTTDKAKMVLRAEDAPVSVKSLFPELSTVVMAGMPRAEAKDLLPAGTWKVRTPIERSSGGVPVRIGEDPVRVQELFGPRLRGLEPLLPEFLAWLERERIRDAEAIEAVRKEFGLPETAPAPEPEKFYRHVEANPWHCHVFSVKDRKGDWVLLQRWSRKDGPWGQPVVAVMEDWRAVREDEFTRHYREWEGGAL